MTPEGRVPVCAAGRRVLLRVEEESLWPTQESPCDEPAHKAFQMVTPGIGRYVFVEPLCERHEAEFLSHFELQKGPFVPEGREYQVRAKRVGDLWELTIPNIGVTQCGGYLGDAWPMVIDYIRVQTGETVTEGQIRLVMEGDPSDYFKRPEGRRASWFRRIRSNSP